MFVSEPPATAAWEHRDARRGFEVVYLHRVDDGYRIDGCTTAEEDGHSWLVDYTISLARTWETRSARIATRSASGASTPIRR
jgi:uncharacterized protein